MKNGVKNMEEKEEKKRTEENDKKQKLSYSEYYNNLLLKEQPFYRKGMSEAEREKEEEYLNKNLKDFYDGKYMPLWKQDWFR